jgi:ankyrin repeat protein
MFWSAFFLFAMVLSLSHVAAGQTGIGSTEVVRLLLEMGANIDAMDNKGKTALFYATAYGYTAVANILREKGAH